MSNAPKVRFAGFTGDWEQRKFDEIADRASATSSDPALPRVEYEDIISGAGRLNKDVATKESTKVGISFHAGDVLYGKLRPYLQNWLLPTFSGLAVGDFWVLQPQNVDSAFLYQLVQSCNFDEIANQSTGTKMPRADWKLVSRAEFSVPQSIDEQALIGHYFNDLDTLITLHQHEYEKLVSLKSACLDKMFPQNGSKVPELRFAGFTGDWEQRKLGDAACIIGGNAWKSTDYSDSGEYLVVTIANVSGDVFINDAVGNHLSCDNPEGYLLDENDILVSLTGNVGRVSKMTRIQGLLNQRVGKIVPNSSDVNAGFLFHVLRNPCFEKAMIDAGQGAAQKNISNSDVLNYSFLLPVDKDEQASIACYFDELDSLITLHQRKLEKLKQLKQSMLYSMFV